MDEQHGPVGRGVIELGKTLGQLDGAIEGSREGGVWAISAWHKA
jgi:hypothetical protein